MALHAAAASTSVMSSGTEAPTVPLLHRLVNVCEDVISTHSSRKLVDEIERVIQLATGGASVGTRRAQLQEFVGVQGTLVTSMATTSVTSLMLRPLFRRFEEELEASLRSELDQARMFDHMFGAIQADIEQKVRVILTSIGKVSGATKPTAASASSASASMVSLTSDVSTAEQVIGEQLVRQAMCLLRGVFLEWFGDLRILLSTSSPPYLRAHDIVGKEIHAWIKGQTRRGRELDERLQALPGQQSELFRVATQEFVTEVRTILQQRWREFAKHYQPQVVKVILRWTKTNGARYVHDLVNRNYKHEDMREHLKKLIDLVQRIRSALKLPPLPVQFQPKKHMPSAHAPDVYKNSPSSIWVTAIDDAFTELVQTRTDLDFNQLAKYDEGINVLRKELWPMVVQKRKVFLAEEGLRATIDLTRVNSGIGNTGDSLMHSPPRIKLEPSVAAAAATPITPSSTKKSRRGPTKKSAFFGRRIVELLELNVHNTIRQQMARDELSAKRARQGDSGGALEPVAIVNRQLKQMNTQQLERFKSVLADHPVDADLLTDALQVHLNRLKSYPHLQALTANLYVMPTPIARAKSESMSARIAAQLAIRFRAAIAPNPVNADTRKRKASDSLSMVAPAAAASTTRVAAAAVAPLPSLTASPAASSSNAVSTIFCPRKMYFIPLQHPTTKQFSLLVVDWRLPHTQPTVVHYDAAHGPNLLLGKQCIPILSEVTGQPVLCVQGELPACSMPNSGAVVYATVVALMALLTEKSAVADRGASAAAGSGNGARDDLLLLAGPADRVAPEHGHPAGLRLPIDPVGTPVGVAPRAQDSS